MQEDQVLPLTVEANYDLDSNIDNADEMLNICDVLESSAYFFLEEGCDKND